jgi:hypothetical protein
VPAPVGFGVFARSAPAHGQSQRWNQAGMGKRVDRHLFGLVEFGALVGNPEQD